MIIEVTDTNKSSKPNTSNKKNKSVLMTNTSSNDSELGDIELETEDKTLINDEPFRVGNCYALWYKNGDPILTIGPYWSFYICLNFTIIAIFFTYMHSLWNYLNIFIKILGFSLWFVQFTSYTYTFLINPGIPNKNTKISNQNHPKFKDYRICQVCMKLMNLEINTNHCNECGVCVEGKIIKCILILILIT